MQGKPIAEQETGKQLLLEAASYAEGSICRRKMLLHYFGEEYNVDNCCNCDNCLHPKNMIDVKDLLCAVLELVSTLGGKFKAEVITDILMGKDNIETDAYRFEDLELFGSVTDEKEIKLLPAVIRQAIVDGYLTKKIENYGILKISKLGKDFLAKPHKLMIAEGEDFSDSDDSDAVAKGGGSSALDAELFSILKDLRKKYSKKLNLPPFAIFQDPSLEAM